MMHLILRNYRQIGFAAAAAGGEAQLLYTRAYATFDGDACGGENGIRLSAAACVKALYFAMALFLLVNFLAENRKIYNHYI